MRKGKEVLYFLLFVVLSCLVWLVRAVNASQPVTQNTESVVTEEVITDDALTEKKLDVPVEVQDVPNDKSVRVFPSKVAVYVRVHVSDYERVTADGIHVWCSYPTRAADVLPLHTDVTDERIQRVRLVPEKVEYLIEQE